MVSAHRLTEESDCLGLSKIAQMLARLSCALAIVMAALTAGSMNYLNNEWAYAHETGKASAESAESSKFLTTVAWTPRLSNDEQHPLHWALRGRFVETGSSN